MSSSKTVAAMQSPTNRRVRVAVLCDLAEENWPSMDLVGDMLTRTLSSDHNQQVAPTKIRPTLTGSYHGKLARFLGRFLRYPNKLKPIEQDFDLFHVVDHSYAHLVHYLRPERTIVTCHDLDTFRCLLDPQQEPRSVPFRIMTGRILSGLKKAAHVTCDTAATRDAILRHGLLPVEKLTVVHNGVAPEFCVTADPKADKHLEQLLGRGQNDCPEILHVGSTIPRKRIDTLLQMFYEVRQAIPKCRLLRIGGPFTNEQLALAKRIGVDAFIDVLPRLDFSLIAAAYRRAAVTVLTSEAEGFGLPLIESLACGTPVVASDIPALREIGASAVRFCPVGEATAFARAVVELQKAPINKSVLVEHAAQFSWSKYAEQMTKIYSKVLAS
jgi:glycosyltransferase involved in cell wall biosynthesis